MGVIAREVKEEILGRVKAGEKIRDISDQYGVSDRTIYNWLGKKATGSISLVEHNRLKRENQMLKEIVGVLNLELQKVKKRGQSGR